jgi:hypothetical protein
VEIKPCSNSELDKTGWPTSGADVFTPNERVLLATQLRAPLNILLRSFIAKKLTVEFYRFL